MKGILFIVSIMGSAILDWMSEHMLTCPSKKFLHIDCPGCGMQRSFIALLRGDFSESFRLYPITIPLLVLIIYALLHVKFNFTNGAKFIRWMQVFCATGIVVFYIYKVCTHQVLG